MDDSLHGATIEDKMAHDCARKKVTDAHRKATEKLTFSCLIIMQHTDTAACRATINTIESTGGRIELVEYVDDALTGNFSPCRIIIFIYQ